MISERIYFYYRDERHDTKQFTMMVMQVSVVFVYVQLLFFTLNINKLKVFYIIT